MVDFHTFLKLNGQDFETMKLFTTNSTLSTEKEIFLGHVVKQQKGEQIVREESARWRDLKATKLVLPSGTYENPWAHRFAYGGKEIKPWLDEFREIGSSSIKLGLPFQNLWFTFCDHKFDFAFITMKFSS